jgi:hypothetical protein
MGLTLHVSRLDGFVSLFFLAVSVVPLLSGGPFFLSVSPFLAPSSLSSFSCFVRASARPFCVPLSRSHYVSFFLLCFPCPFRLDPVHVCLVYTSSRCLVFFIPKFASLSLKRPISIPTATDAHIKSLFLALCLVFTVRLSISLDSSKFFRMSLSFRLLFPVHLLRTMASVSFFLCQPHTFPWSLTARVRT